MGNAVNRAERRRHTERSPKICQRSEAENDYQTIDAFVAQPATQLVKSQDHPNVEVIFEQLKKDFPTMSRATIYRNVMLLKSLGEVLEIGFPDGGNRYDGNKPYPHPQSFAYNASVSSIRI